jgi:23S rRNA A2030 N6-methylase RlmJ
LVIVNPPYGTDEYLRDAYAAIHAGIAASGAGYVEVSRLTPERMAQ